MCFIHEQIRSPREGMTMAPSQPSCTSAGRAAILDRFAGDRDLLREIASLFLEEYPRQLRNLKDAVSRQDSKAMQLAAHCIKGSVINFSAAAAAEAALRIELMGCAGEVSAAAEACMVLEQEIAQLTSVLVTVL
jgi:HPt (histidine-containing phosphotransfer) domain-containing protein